MGDFLLPTASTMNITMKATGIKEVARALGKNHEQAILHGFNEIGTDALQFTREEAPKKTGELRSQIGIRRYRWTWSIVEGPTKHGLWVREGTKPHLIVPVKKKALYWPGLPHPVAYANNPGIRNRNLYPERARSRLVGGIDSKLSMVAQAIVLDIG